MRRNACPIADPLMEEKHGREYRMAGGMRSFTRVSEEQMGVRSSEPGS